MELTEKKLDSFHRQIERRRKKSVRRAILELEKAAGVKTLVRERALGEPFNEIRYDVLFRKKVLGCEIFALNYSLTELEAAVSGFRFGMDVQLAKKK